MRLFVCILLCAIAVHAEDVQQAEARLHDELKRAFEEGEADAAMPDEDVVAIQRVLDGTRVDVDFDHAEPEDVVSYLREVARINIEIDERARECTKGRASFHMRGALMREALQAVLDHWDLHCKFDHKVLLIVALPPVQGRLSATITRKAPAPADAEVLERLRKTRVSLNPGCIPISETLGFLDQYCDVRFRILPFSAEALSKKADFSALGDWSVDSVLDLFGSMNGFVWVADHGEVLVMTPGDAARMVDVPSSNKLPAAKDLTPLGKIPQGCEEFCHERTGIVFVKIPSEHPFLLSKNEVTNAQFRRFADLRLYSPGHDSGTLDGVDLNADDLPVTSVTWFDVYGFLEWAGLRLPTEKEWEWAAGGEKASRFPWGDEWPPPKGAGNFADAALGRLGRKWPVETKYDDGVAFLAKAGSSDANLFGVHDLGGNVWEWCAEPFKPREMFTPRTDPLKRFEESKATLRGGAWCELLPSVLAREYRLSIGPNQGSPAIGFRVALDAP